MLTRAEFAALVERESGESCDERKVWRWEEKGVHPRPASMRAVLAVTGMSAVELGWANGGQRARVETPIDGLTPDDEDRLAMAARQPSRVDRPAVEALAVMLAGQRRLEDAIGSTAVLAPVSAQLAVIEDLVVAVRGPIRPVLADVAAQWAQFNGWLRASVGELRAARSQFDRAAEWAAEAGNVDMAATALSFKGHLAWMVGQPGPLIGLSQAAQRDRRVFVGQRAFDAHQEARGHAMAGDADQTDRRLDEGVELSALAAAQSEEERPPWMYYYSPSFFTLLRGVAHRYLGRCDPARNEQAIDALTAGLAAMPAESRRAEWVVDYLVELVGAYTQAGEPELAARAAAEAAAIAHDTSSTTAADRVARLHARLAARWPTVPAIDELGELMRATAVAPHLGMDA